MNTFLEEVKDFAKILSLESKKTQSRHKTEEGQRDVLQINLEQTVIIISAIWTERQLRQTHHEKKTQAVE